MNEHIEKILKQADEERMSGDTQKAIVLYRQAAAEASGEIKISALHMLGVCYRMAHQLPESAKALTEVLQEKLSDKEKANVLRDLGDTLRVQERYDEAAEKLEESLKLLRQFGEKHEIAATLGFISRVHFSKKNITAALEKAKEASELFAEDVNRKTELYHNIFHARVIAHSGDVEGAKAAAKHLIPHAHKHGKPAHVERLEIIHEHAHDPEKMEHHIKNQKHKS